MTEKKVMGVDPIYDLKELPRAKALLLGLQHTFAMFGATILVPLLTGLDVSTALLMAGIGTLLFHLITGGKVPAFLGSSFAFLGGYAAVAPMIDGKANLERLPYAGGGIIVAGVIYLIMAAFIKLYGVERVMRFFPPVVTGPIIISIGLILSPTAIQNASNDWLLALTALAIVVICNIWGRGMIRILPIILGLAGSYLLAVILHRVDFTAFHEVIDKGQILVLPVRQSAFAKFDLSSILMIAPIALATMMEHIGDISAISATTERNFIKDPGLHRTLLGDGLATILAAFFGGPANTTYGENTGVLALTKVYDPRVCRIAALFAIILSFIPALSSIISTIPAAIIGGISMILYGMISAVGIRNLVENKVDFTLSRNLIVAAVILVSALGFSAVGGITFEVGQTSINLSGLAIAALVGILLNAILPGKDYIFTEEKHPDTGVNFSGTDTEALGSKN